MAEAIAAYGAVGAVLLCLIRYRCNVPGPDRIEGEDGRLWRIGHAEMGAPYGFSRDAVRRALVKLEAAGAIVVEHLPEHYGDQRRAYRVLPDAEIWEEDGEPLTGQYANSHTTSPASTRFRTLSVGDSAHCQNAISHSLPLIEEGVEEGGEEGHGSASESPSPRVPAPVPPTLEHDDPPALADAGAPDTAGDPPVYRSAEGRPVCEEHAGMHGRDIPACWDCGQAKQDAKAREDDDAQDEARRRREALARREQCPDCDDMGHLLGPDGLPADVGIKCAHTSLLESVA
ncbi:hypothetical protein MX572_22985 (plasmid) [Rhodococcus pyridinivorans]|uniref:hypothetical protein n=1 Tax=Rhodococcus pyridinivorans TaxID=103816 RepID=UPI0020C6041C|nr:hypothetical protein [Rhodococcus pyridinivorans]UTM39665.1 hypothetical protein MX572_23040 [Rhodococcus pyridinivorans]UTM39677.1 hypothetical protein MX572_22985 [Rhodococcus pyridinivorans]